MEIVVGSSDHACLGFKLDKDECLTPTFVECLTSSVTALAVSPTSPRIVACASNDEMIYLFDMSNKKSLGTIGVQSGTISGLQFFGHDKMFLFSSSMDGSVAIFTCHSANKWSLFKVFKTKSPVHAFSIHPEGKVMITLLHDKTVRRWDLADGSHISKLFVGRNGIHVLFSPDGSTFAVSIGNTIDIYDTDMNEKIHQLSLPGRVNTFQYLSMSRILCGGDFNEVRLEDFLTKKNIASWKLDEPATRTKWLDTVECNDTDGKLVSVSTNNNLLHLLKISGDDLHEFKKLTQVETKCIPKFCVSFK